MEILNHPTYQISLSIKTNKGPISTHFQYKSCTQEEEKNDLQSMS